MVQLLAFSVKQVLLNNLATIILSADIRTDTDSMMSSLKWLKLDDRWNNHILVMLYKCLTGRAPDYLCSKFSFTNSTHDHDTRGTSSNSLVVPQSKNNSGKRWFQVRAANLWNSSVDVDTCTNYISLSLILSLNLERSQNPLIIDFSIVFNFHGSIFFKVLYNGPVYIISSCKISVILM